jgi:hypothetical protein
MPGAVGQRARRGHHAVGAGPEPRQLVRERSGHPLHAADLTPRGGASVDYDRTDLIG